MIPGLGPAIYSEDDNFHLHDLPEEDLVSDCLRCGDPVISEMGATRTDDGWVHDLCLASFKQFGPMYPKEAA